MSRSSKQKRKQKKKILVALTSVAIVAIVVVLFLFKDKLFGEEAPDDSNEIIGVEVNPGDGAEQNKSEGDVNKDKNHDLPYYMDQYLGGSKENPILKEDETTEKKLIK